MAHDNKRLLVGLVFSKVSHIILLVSLGKQEVYALDLV